MRKAAVTLVVLVSAALLLRVSGARLPWPSAVPVEPGPERSTSQVPARHEVLVSVESKEEPPARTPVDPDPDEVESEGRTERLSGTIVVVDEAGVEHALEDGRFEAGLSSDIYFTSEEVEVRSGRWEVEWHLEEPLESVAIEGIVLAGRGAVLEPFAEVLPVPASLRLDLRARWPSPTVLHVLDRASGRELDPILVVEQELWSFLSHPGVDLGILGLGSSPVILAPGDWVGERRLLVASNGYAWKAIEIDERVGGRRFVALEPGGELQVSLVRSAPATDLRLRLRTREGLLRAEIEDPAEVVLLERLTPGVYRASAELGPIGSAWELDATEVVIVAGQRTSATLTPAALPARSEAPLSGFLDVPRAWQLEPFSLVFRLEGVPLGDWRGRKGLANNEMTREEAGDRVRYHWTLPAARVGSYLASIDEIGWWQPIDLSETGLEGIRLDVPPPCEVSVRWVDEAGAPVEVEQVFWRTRASDWGRQSAKWNGPTEAWLFRACPGELQVGTSVEDLFFHREDASVVPGSNEFELRIPRVAAVRVRLRDGANWIPWFEEWELRFRPLEGQDPERGGSDRESFWHDDPGSYALLLPELDGYEPVPEQIVRLEKGVVQELVIELRARW